MFGGRCAGETDLRHGILGDTLADGVLGSGAGGQLDGVNDGKGGREDGGGEEEGGPINTTQWLTRRHGVKRKRIMYVHLPNFQRRVLVKIYWSALKLVKV